MTSHFFAMMSRMKYIERWALMRNSRSENISEHSLEVAMLAHALAIISNKRLGNNLDASKAALIALYHDSTEIITGDMPTPIKYYNPEINEAFKQIEATAADNLLKLLPDDLRDEYTDMFKSGIVDPAKVTRSALVNAASVGSMLLTTEAAVVDIPEEKPETPAMPPMGGMGGF